MDGIRGLSDLSLPERHRRAGPAAPPVRASPARWPARSRRWTPCRARRTARRSSWRWAAATCTRRRSRWRRPTWRSGSLTKVRNKVVEAYQEDHADGRLARRGGAADGAPAEAAPRASPPDRRASRPACAWCCCWAAWPPSAWACGAPSPRPRPTSTPSPTSPPRTPPRPPPRSRPPASPSASRPAARRWPCPASKVYDARLLLAGAGLPRGGGVGFEIFDRGDLGVSEFTQKVNLRRATEGELARTISRLAEVRTARVHLTLPEKGLYRDQDRARGRLGGGQPAAGPHAGRARAGRHPPPGRLGGAGARPAARSRSWTAGARCSRPTARWERPWATSAGWRSDLEQRVVDLLEQAVGPGAVVARVTATIDASEVQTSAQVVDPDSATRAQRAQALPADGHRAAATGGGVAGRGRQPAAGGRRPRRRRPAAAASPPPTTRPATSTSPPPPPPPWPSVPRLQRISVAVLIDGKDGKPRPEAELAAAGRAGQARGRVRRAPAATPSTSPPLPSSAPRRARPWPPPRPRGRRSRWCGPCSIGLGGPDRPGHRGLRAARPGAAGAGGQLALAARRPGGGDRGRPGARGRRPAAGRPPGPARSRQQPPRAGQGAGHQGSRPRRLHPEGLDGLRAEPPATGPAQCLTPRSATSALARCLRHRLPARRRRPPGHRPDVATAVFKALGETELRRIAARRQGPAHPRAQVMNDALEQFVNTMESVAGDAAGGDDLLREVAERALGPDAARRAFDGVRAPAAARRGAGAGRRRPTPSRWPWCCSASSPRPSPWSSPRSTPRGPPA